jgi:hypothetical protein
LINDLFKHLRDVRYVILPLSQIAGSFVQYEKTRLVTKLRGARDRIREASGKCEGRKSYAEHDPELVLATPALAQRAPKITQGDCTRVDGDGLLQQARRAVLGVMRQVDGGGAVALSARP